jgi:hypothetical protein
VEVTIKRLENMLLDEVIKLRSMDLLHFYAQSPVEYDVDTGALSKKGRALKEGDSFHLPGDAEAWEVKSFVRATSLAPHELVEGCTYDIVSTRDKTVLPYQLGRKDVASDMYQFTANGKILERRPGRLPSIYRSGEGRTDPSGIVIALKNDPSQTMTLSFDEVADKRYALDVASFHVLIASG